MSLVVVAMSMTAFMAATMFTVDVGMMMTSRAQAQNAADAGALAGAVALAFNDYTDRSAGGPAVTAAIAAAKANAVMSEQVSINPSDVEFINDANGQPNWVRVTVRRTAERGNPISTFIAASFGHPTVDVGATATAEAAPANAATCVKPWTVPNRWVEKQTPGWDTTDTFSAYPLSPTLSPDIYVPVDQNGFSGYRVSVDVGLQIIIKTAATASISPTAYTAIDLPGSSGATDFQSDVETCNAGTMQIGDLMTTEPANVTASTKNGVDALIAKDPGAYWDAANKRVVSSLHPSPRVVVIPLYDPYYRDTGKKNGNTAAFKIADFMGFFIEGAQANGNVTGRIVPVAGLLEGSGPTLPGAFARSIRLVQ